jgi:hypothetical protein
MRVLMRVLLFASVFRSLVLKHCVSPSRSSLLSPFFLIVLYHMSTATSSPCVFSPCFYGDFICAHVMCVCVCLCVCVWYSRANRFTAPRCNFFFASSSLFPLSPHPPFSFGFVLFPPRRERGGGRCCKAIMKDSSLFIGGGTATCRLVALPPYV